MGNKATIKVTKHQGTPNEAIEFHTVMLDSQWRATVKVHMADGRRTESESVPVEATVRRLPNNRGQTQDEVYQMLRSMADPMLAAARPGMKGGTSATGSLNRNVPRPNANATGRRIVAPDEGVTAPSSSGVDLLDLDDDQPGSLDDEDFLYPVVRRRHGSPASADLSGPGW